MENDVAQLIREQIKLSTDLVEASERKTQAYTKQALEYQRYSDELEKQRISEEEKTKELAKSNKIAEERLKVLENLVDIIKKLFLDDRTIEKLLNNQSLQINDINIILHKISTILQIQAYKVIEAMAIDDKTKKEYDKLLETLKVGLHREPQINTTEITSGRDINTRDIIGGDRSDS